MDGIGGGKTWTGERGEVNSFGRHAQRTGVCDKHGKQGERGKDGIPNAAKNWQSNHHLRGGTGRQKPAAAMT